jgi:hypothetical protein
MDTAGNVVLKGYTFLVLWIWMCVDVGLWLRSPGYTKEWKIIRFQAIGGAGAISMLMTIHWLLDLKLDEKQQDVYRNISARVSLPQKSIPSLSLFSVSNGGNSTIGKHQIGCYINLLVGNSGTTSARDFVSTMETFDAPLAPNGDSETVPCVPLEAEHGWECLDVTLFISYSLEIQPEKPNRKNFRFVAYNFPGGGFQWVQQRLAAPKSYCASYLKQPAEH